jgi:hypothetical protein
LEGNSCKSQQINIFFLETLRFNLKLFVAIATSPSVWAGVVIIPSSKAYEHIKETEQENIADKLDDDGDDDGAFAASIIEPKMEIN